jgi:hypothetical protein
VLNTENELYGRLEGLFRCTLPSGSSYDIALVQKLKPSRRWKPKTLWDGCKILEESDSMFILLQYAVRGVLVVPAASWKGRRYFYRDDMVDNDAFCRFNNL